MYTVEDETFVQARAIVSAVARELAAQQASGSRHRVALHDLVRRSRGDLPEGGETAYVGAIAEKLEKSFPISELFPRRRRGDRS